MPNQKYDIIFTRVVASHLLTIDRKYHSLIRDSIQEQLQYEPLLESRNRKPLKKPIKIGATWELRLGVKNEFRVFYEVDLANYQVLIVAA